MSIRDKSCFWALRPTGVRAAVWALASLLLASCGNIERTQPNTYYAEPVPPAKQELRWSNGKLPRSFDPALAESPPESDVVRAIYRGLASVDPKTLAAVPALAEKWSTDDNKTWTFQIRKDARWTNGKSVTAQDFVRSWNRLLSLGDKAAHPDLLKIFAKIKTVNEEKPARAGAEASPSPASVEQTPSPTASPAVSPTNSLKPSPKTTETLNVTATSDLVLSVVLEAPDADLPSVLADPVFSPVFGDGSEFSGAPESIVTNGPFRIASSGKDGLVLAKSDTYFDKDTVKLDSVRIVPTQSAEDALSAYRAGQLDVVTNTELEPAALKLLTPYEDFRRATNGALNMYEFNRSRPPFDDERVRQALAIGIERERLTDGELEGTTRPALRYLPFGGKQVEPLVQDADAARDLLTDAGFPNGQGFPMIRLVVNRNDTQQRIARAVARMWKQNLNIDTEIIAKDATDIPAFRASGDFDLIRKGIVFPTADPQTNVASVLSSIPVTEQPHPSFGSRQNPPAEANASPHTGSEEVHQAPGDKTTAEHRSAEKPIPTEEDALYDLPAIPLYFPTSYSLVKPYVHGFEPNGLDLFLLDQISIDNSWQPKAATSES